MADTESTNPAPGVEKAQPSIEERMQKALFGNERKAPQPKEVEPAAPLAAEAEAEPVEAQASDEPTPDDLPDEDGEQAAVEDFLHQRIAARYYVADHEHVGFQRDLRRVKAFGQGNALGFELGAHRRIDAGIAAGDLVPGLLRQHRNAAHEGTADAEYVNMHE